MDIRLRFEGVAQLPPSLGDFGRVALSSPAEHSAKLKAVSKEYTGGGVALETGKRIGFSFLSLILWLRSTKTGIVDERGRRGMPTYKHRGHDVARINAFRSCEWLL